MVLKIPKFKDTEKVVYLVFLLIPVVQLLNSFIMFSAGESMFGKIFRLLTLIVMLLLCKGKIKSQILTIILILLFSCGTTVVVDTFRGIKLGTIEWINSILKLLSPMIYYASLDTLCEARRIREKVIHAILISWSFFLTVSMIVPYFLGLGYYKYEGNGYTGFYYENDSLNIVLCCLLLYVFNYAVNQREKKYYLLAAMLFGTVVLTGSKTSLMYAVVVCFYVLFLNKKISILRLFKRLLLLLLMLVVTLVVINTLEDNIISKQIAYYVEVYKWSTTIGGDTSLAVFTNGRTSKALYCMTNLWSANNILDVLFGIGGYGAEMDFFDTYMKFGLVPILIICFLCWLVARKCSRHDVYSFALLLILIYAFVAGHVVESSFTCGLLALFVLSLKFKNIENAARQTLGKAENERDCGCYDCI